MATTATRPRERTLAEILPPYNVILLNDDVHPMDYVVIALLRSVPALTLDRAAELMAEAHTTGQAVVITCPLEPAELYRDRIQTYGLGALVERA